MTTMAQTQTTGGTPVPRRGASSAAVILGWMAAGRFAEPAAVDGEAAQE